MVRNHRETPVSCDKSSLQQASSRLDGKEVGRNLVLQATRVHAVHTASATPPRAFHSSDSPPQRDGSSCPSRARKRAPKSMPASPAGHASEDEKTVYRRWCFRKGDTCRYAPSPGAAAHHMCMCAGTAEGCFGVSFFLIWDV